MRDFRLRDLRMKVLLFNSIFSQLNTGQNVMIQLKLNLQSIIFKGTLPNLIQNDKSDNMCYKFMAVEQAGERFHPIWNTLNRGRFFSVKDPLKKLLYTYMAYENLLYME